MRLHGEGDGSSPYLALHCTLWWGMQVASSLLVAVAVWVLYMLYCSDHDVSYLFLFRYGSKCYRADQTRRMGVWSPELCARRPVGSSLEAS